MVVTSHRIERVPITDVTIGTIMSIFFKDGVDRTKKAKAVAKEAFEQYRENSADINVALFLFGSYGRGESVPHSDIDILIVPSAATTVEDFESFRAFMLQALENSALYNRGPLWIDEIELTPWQTLEEVKIYAKTCLVAYNAWLNTTYVCGANEATKEGCKIREECFQDKARIRHDILFHIVYFKYKADRSTTKKANDFKHCIGGIRYFLFLSWFARYTASDVKQSFGSG